METKQFLCIWGSWDKKAMFSYDDRIEVMGLSFFTLDQGYPKGCFRQLDKLEVGEMLNDPDNFWTGGNHIIIRINNKNL